MPLAVTGSPIFFIFQIEDEREHLTDSSELLLLSYGRPWLHFLIFIFEVLAFFFARIFGKFTCFFGSGPV